MKLLRFLLCLVLTEFAWVAHGQDGNRLFYDAVRTEAAGDLDDAITYYEKAASQAHSANLHGNLANLYLKTGNHGKAILHYRKALLLAPNNRELRANLTQAREIAGLPVRKATVDDSYFAPTTIGVWCWGVVILFWAGLWGNLFFLRALLPFYLKAVVMSSWAILVAFGAYATWRTDNNIQLLAREAVAVASDTSNGEEPSSIRLRRFAGDANGANAELKPGEIVHIDVGEDSTLKEHETPDGTIWYLARSRYGGKKGWATTKELIRILD